MQRDFEFANYPVKIEDLLTWGGIIFLIAIVLVEIDIQTLGMH